MSKLEQAIYALAKSHMSNEEIAARLELPLLVINRIEADLEHYLERI